MILDWTEEEERIAYFQTLYDAFLRAESRVGSSLDRFYHIGGYTIRLRFAGAALSDQMTAAIEHLATPPMSNPDLIICLWDNVSTNTKFPLLISSLVRAWSSAWPELLDIRGEIKGYNSDRIRAAFHPGPNILTLLDNERKLALYWLNDASLLPYYERGSPLKTILNWWLGTQKQQYVHAGAVGFATGGVLLAGKGGSGKSTTALSCLNSELFYASDDYCLVACDSEPYVYSLYNTAKLKGAEDIARFPHLGAKISNANRLEEEKAMLFVQEHFPEKVVTGFPIKAVLLPRVTGKPDTFLEKASSGAALAALAPSTIFQLPSAGKQAFQFMTKLVREVDCYYLNAGTNLSQIPQVIIDLLADEL